LGSSTSYLGIATNGSFVSTAAIGWLATHALGANVRYVENDLNIRIHSEGPLPAITLTTI
jgi:hypothetical protein